MKQAWILTMMTRWSNNNCPILLSTINQLLVPNDNELYQNISFSFNYCTVQFHKNNEVQNDSAYIDNPRKCRRIIYSSDSSQEQWKRKNYKSPCFLLLGYSDCWIYNEHFLLTLHFCAKNLHFISYIPKLLQSLFYKAFVLLQKILLLIWKNNHTYEGCC